MKKGTSFPEIMFSLLIVSIGLFTFLKLSSDYIKTLIFSKEIFVLNNLTHEKYQLLIAYRNKITEMSTSQIGSSTVETLQSGDFCLDFDNETSKIIRKNASSCQYVFLSGKESNKNYIININSPGDLVSVNISASSSGLFKINTQLSGFLTNWHPIFNFK